MYALQKRLWELSFDGCASSRVYRYCICAQGTKRPSPKIHYNLFVVNRSTQQWKHFFTAQPAQALDNPSDWRVLDRDQKCLYFERDCREEIKVQDKNYVCLFHWNFYSGTPRMGSIPTTTTSSCPAPIFSVRLYKTSTWKVFATIIRRSQTMLRRIVEKECKLLEKLYWIEAHYC